VISDELVVSVRNFLVPLPETCEANALTGRPLGSQAEASGVSLVGPKSEDLARSQDHEGRRHRRDNKSDDLDVSEAVMKVTRGPVVRHFPFSRRILITREVTRYP
jgi:hypothetical protein